MKNKTVKGIIALAVVTALSFAVIIGSNQLSKNMTAGTQGETAEITEELDVSGTEQIDKAAKTESDYVAVSYTHLDVYKRQMYRYPKNLLPKQELPPPEMSHGQEALLPAHLD